MQKLVIQLTSKDNARFGCIYGGVETPVPISNTEVKHSIGDGTAPTVWESSTTQPYNIEKPWYLRIRVFYVYIAFMLG